MKALIRKAKWRQWNFELPFSGSIADARRHCMGGSRGEFYVEPARSDFTRSDFTRSDFTRSDFTRSDLVRSDLEWKRKSKQVQ
jgi:uncharacterized protein YjbI with pentapeptide repeats